MERYSRNLIKTKTWWIIPVWALLICSFGCEIKSIHVPPEDILCSRPDPEQNEQRMEKKLENSGTVGHGVDNKI
ncbi:MAG: hypothetical protein OEM02_08625 [Desulfobulbaceae bacterium]|nr:hypothetical protein [Desulfobulbaceae bacterium]